MQELQETLWAWVLAGVGWLTALVASLIGWIFKSVVFERIAAIESRMRALEIAAEATVKHTELAQSVDGLRDEIRETRLEIKGDVRQLMDLLQK